MRVLLLSPFSPQGQHNHAAADTLVQLVPRLADKVELFVYSPQNTGAAGLRFRHTTAGPAWIWVPAFAGMSGTM